MRNKASKVQILCPVCEAELSPEFIKRASGRLVGAIKGKAKAHSSEVARKAVMARWAKARGKG